MTDSEKSSGTDGSTSTRGGGRRRSTASQSEDVYSTAQFDSEERGLVVDPDLLKRYVALERTLHGAIGVANRGRVNWDGTSHAMTTAFKAILDNFREFEPPQRPSAPHIGGPVRAEQNGN